MMNTLKTCVEHGKCNRFLIIKSRPQEINIFAFELFSFSLSHRWNFARVPQTINLFLMLYALYYSTESYVMIMWMMIPNLEGTSCSTSESVMSAVFDATWEEHHKYNFPCHMLFSMGWFFLFLGVVCTLLFFSLALANKHRVFAKQLKQQKQKIIPKQEMDNETKKPSNNEDVETLLRELVEKQGELQKQILNLVSTIAKKSESD